MYQPWAALSQPCPSLWLSPRPGAPHPLSLCSCSLGPVPIQSAPLRKLDLCSPSEARFVPPRNFQRSYFWRPCRSVAAWVIQLLALLLAREAAPGSQKSPGTAVPAGRCRSCRTLLWLTLARVLVTAALPALHGVPGWLQAGAPAGQGWVRGIGVPFSEGDLVSPAPCPCQGWVRGIGVPVSLPGMARGSLVSPCP